MDRLPQTDRSLAAGVIVSLAGLLQILPPDYNDSQVELCQTGQKMGSFGRWLNLPPCAGLDSG